MIKITLRFPTPTPWSSHSKFIHLVWLRFPRIWNEKDNIFEQASYQYPWKISNSRLKTGKLQITYAYNNAIISFRLSGNKTDCKSSSRVIRREDGEKLAREYNVAFMETSAKTGLNVDLAFTAIARWELLFLVCPCT